MNVAHQLISVVLFVMFSIEIKCENNLSRGFNENINWQSMEDGKAAAKASGKPIMVLIHKSWCGACKNLKPTFAGSAEIETLSSRFVMVNILDSEDEKIGKGFTPDGSYIPRILFTDSEGEVQEDIYNELGNDQYKYYYTFPAQIIESMKRASKRLSPDKPVNSDL